MFVLVGLGGNAVSDRAMCVNVQQPGHGVGAAASRIGDVLHLCGVMRDRLQGAAQEWQEDRLLPVSDVALRDFSRVSGHWKLPEAPETLMLGAPSLICVFPLQPASESQVAACKVIGTP